MFDPPARWLVGNNYGWRQNDQRVSMTDRYEVLARYETGDSVLYMEKPYVLDGMNPLPAAPGQRIAIFYPRTCKACEGTGEAVAIMENNNYDIPIVTPCGECVNGMNPQPVATALITKVVNDRYLYITGAQPWEK